MTVSIKEFKDIPSNSGSGFSSKEVHEDHVFADLNVKVEEATLQENGELKGVFGCVECSQSIPFRAPSYDEASFTLEEGNIYELIGIQKITRDGVVQALVRNAITEVNMETKPNSCQCGKLLNESHIETNGPPELGWEYVKCPDCGNQYEKDIIKS